MAVPGGGVGVTVQEAISEQVQRITALVRRIDPLFEAEGGSTRHWVRDFFLPALEADGLALIEVADRAALVAERDAANKTAGEMLARIGRLADEADRAHDRAEQAVAERDRYRDTIIEIRNLCAAGHGDDLIAETADRALAVSTP